MPDDLSAAPIDRFTQNQLVFRLADDGPCRVYSCRPDGDDDGGRNSPGHDLDADVVVERNLIQRE